MIISNSKKFIHVHIYKCGGTSVSYAIQPYLEWNDFIADGTKYGQDMDAVWGDRYGLGKHSTAKEIRTVVGESVWNEYFTFSFVRDPLSRMTSLYRWTEKRVNKLGWRRYARHISKRWQVSFWKRPHVRAYVNTSSFSDFIRHQAPHYRTL